MLIYKSGGLETADRRVESHTNYQPSNRTLALDTATPVAYADATVIFCESFERTPHGLRYGGDVPLFLFGTSQPENIRSQLANANYSSDDIAQAFERGHWLHEKYPENAQEAIAYAEHRAQEGRQ